jgi:RND family efflux transporter MFP subunit
MGIGIFVLMSSRNKSLASEAKAKEALVDAGPTIKTALVSNSIAGRNFTVIGEVKPYQSVTLYAKISGYLQHISIDKGDQVKEGQILATIESPELDEQYQSAQIDAANKKTIMQRDEELLKKKYISQEQADLSATAYKVANSAVNTLKAQLDYKTIRAPFNGTVTARFADNGALVQSAANSQGGALPIATVAQLNKLRIYFYVDQKDASYAQPGYPVQISLQERPDYKLNAKITRTAEQLDAKTRMMLVEVDVDKNDDLIPGSSVQVNIQAPATSKGYAVIPTEALVVRKNKYFVPMLKNDSTIHYQEIKIHENTGEKILVESGLNEGDTVALNLGESVTEGGKVRVTK